jgi:dTDP-4-dehydrorhamnose reductase
VNAPGSRILLLGAGGQIGRALVRVLSDRYALTALTHSDLDITDDGRLAAAIHDAAPDVVVNAAAYTDVDGAESDPDLAVAINAEAPGRLARATHAAGAALVHYSTDYVFDGTGEIPRPEDAPTGPLGAYGRSKLGGEQSIAANCADHLILRTSWVYGAGGKNFVETMLRLGAERERLAVVDDQFGAPTSADVIAEMTVGILAARDGDAGGARGIVHVTCDGSTSWHGFAEEIFDQARRRSVPLVVERVDRISSAKYGAPAPRPRNSRLDCRHLGQRFGLYPPHWKHALERYLDERTGTPKA